MARPIPLEAPVTRATFLLSLISLLRCRLPFEPDRPDDHSGIVGIGDGKSPPPASGIESESPVAAIYQEPGRYYDHGIGWLPLRSSSGLMTLITSRAMSDVTPGYGNDS